MKVTRQERKDGLIEINIDFDGENIHKSTYLTIDHDGNVFEEDGGRISFSELSTKYNEDVANFIQETVKLQEVRAQALRNAVIEDLKRSIALGDDTTIDEILKFVPHQNLVQALPEEQWESFYLVNFHQTQD